MSQILKSFNGIIIKVYVPKIEFRRKLAISLCNIVFLITELDQARTLKDRIIAALKVSKYLCSKNSCNIFLNPWLTGRPL